MVAIVVAVLGSQALKEVVVALIERFGKPSPQKAGLRWLMQDKIDYLATKDIVKGETTRDMRDFLEDGYVVYHKLKGNGDIAHVMEDYEKLPVRY